MALSPDISHKEFKRALQRPTILPLMKNTSSPGKCSLEIQHILLAHNELYSCPCSDRASVLLWTLCRCLVLSTKNQSLLGGESSESVAKIQPQLIRDSESSPWQRTSQDYYKAGTARQLTWSTEHVPPFLASTKHTRAITSLISYI